MYRTLLFTSIVVAGLAASTSFAASKSVVSSANRQTRADAHAEGRSPLVGTSGKTAYAAIKQAAPSTSTNAVSATDVGDADTFGHAVVWDGLISTGTLTFASDCTPQAGDPPPGPNDRCVQLNPAPTVTSFDLPNIGQMTLPGKSSLNILCHWTSANGVYSLFNGTSLNANASIRLTPYLRIQSSVLNDPSLIDPSTGQPFNGWLETNPGTTYRDAETLAPGARKTEQMSDSRVCIAGAISRQGLIQGYGLTNAQVDAFFKNPLTIQFGLRGSAQMLDFASLIYGVRIMGD